MSAWTKLLAASSLAIGTAWQLISSPRTGGVGTIYDQVQTVIDDALIFSSLQDDTVRGSVGDDSISSIISVIDATTSLPDGTITGETS